MENEGNTPENIEKEVIEQPEAIAEPEQEAETKVEVKPEFDYKQDKRWGKIWKSEADIYKSYKEMDRMYPKLQTQLKEIETKLKDSETSKQEYAQVMNYLNTLSQDSRFAPKITEFFNNIEKERKRLHYGENLPDEVYQKLERIEQLEAKMAEKEEQEKVGKLTGSIEEQMSRIKDFAKENEIEFNEIEFLQECSKKNIPPELIISVFKDKAFDELKKNISSKSQKQVMENLKNNRRGNIVTGGNKVSSSKKEATWNDQANAVAEKLSEALI